MSKSYKITVEASKNRKGILDVHDAILQIGDFFTILKGRNQLGVLLNIKTIQKNNPLIVECIPHNTDTLKEDFKIVESNAKAFRELFQDISSGRAWDPSTPQFLRDSTKKILERNINGIESTIFVMPHSDQPHEIEINPDSAKRGLRMLKLPPDSIYASIFRSGKRMELGSVEGPIIAVGKYYGKPALKIEHRSLDREIWCCLSEDEARKWETEMTATHVWKGNRVTVHGELTYGENGKLQKVSNGHVEIMKSSTVSLEDLFDPDFTGGLSSREYLDKLHRGDYGETA